MNETNTIVRLDISYSDNSHILGRPLIILEGVDGYMDIPIIDENNKRSLIGLTEWINKVAFLEKAGIEMHLKYGMK